MAIICERMGIDVWEVIQAAATKPYGFTPFYPGPGIGGHCIPVDPLYLSWKLQALNYRARFIETADEVNSHMPSVVRDRVIDALNDDGRALKGSRVLVLGVAYKADIDDVRESPALEVIHLLLEKGAQVEYCDPHVPSVRIGGQMMTAVAFDRAALEWADCVVIATAHRAFDWRMVTQHSRLVIDTRNATNGYAPAPARIVKL
jgi:UDP-N-acetyl-D-glucosamine dehydrogenase